MTWVLVLYVYAATTRANIAPGDPGILMSPVANKIERIETATPSREVREQVAAIKANFFVKPECWAKDSLPALK
jgi:hypothetical protein